MDPYWFDEVVYDKASGEGVVYNTDVQAISDDLKEYLASYLDDRKNAPPFSVCVEPPAIDTRIRTQKSVFTMHGKSIDPFKIVARDNDDPRIFKIRFSSKAAGYIKWQLDGMGITEGTLFPGLEGVCEDLKWEREID